MNLVGSRVGAVRISLNAVHPTPTVAGMTRDCFDVTLLRNGSHDPTTRVFTSERNGGSKNHIVTRIERATLTPDGPGAVSIAVSAEGDHHVEAWGSGGAWLANRAGRLSARHTISEPLNSLHEVLTRAIRDVGHIHLPASDTPYHELLPAVLGQRITAAQAMFQWATLCRRYGEPAPGPLNLRLPPSPSRLLRIPSWEFHRLGIEGQRARALQVVARHANFVARTVGLDGPAARTALTGLPGIGVWTAAVAIGVSHADPDALPVGDFHIKNTVAWALAGRLRGTDEEMIANLNPYAGHRWQVVRTLERAGIRAPRHAPGRRLLDIAGL